MKMLVGLGNPGNKYKNNRHNAGFMFVDYLQEKFQISNLGFKINKYLLSEICEVSTSPYPLTTTHSPLTTNHSSLVTNHFLLAKPQTYMNTSGEAVKKLCAKYVSNDYSLITNHLFVVHDDLDIPLGKFKIAKGTGPKLHNGIESIENHLHIKDFFRIRIGVDNRTPQNHIPGLDYVLQDFTKEEHLILTSVFPTILSRLTQEKILL